MMKISSRPKYVTVGGHTQHVLLTALVASGASCRKDGAITGLSHHSVSPKTSGDTSPCSHLLDIE